MKATVVMLSLLTASANAASLIITPTSIAYNTSPNQAQGGLNLDNPTNLINGNGLSATPTVANVTTVTHQSASFSSPGNSWATVDPGGFPSDFFASGGTPQTFTIDLGDAYIVTDFVIWGYHAGGGFRSNPSSISLEFSTDGGSSYGAPLPLTLTTAYVTGTSQVINFAGQEANFVRMTVTDNFYDPSDTAAGGDRVGLAEIRFMGDAIPEPTSALLGGLGLIALLRRRR